MMTCVPWFTLLLQRVERSRLLPLLWHCGHWPFSSRTARRGSFGNEPSTVLAEDSALEGLAMLIRSENCGILGGAADAVRVPAISAASLPTLLIGGLLLLIGP